MKGLLRETIDRIWALVSKLVPSLEEELFLMEGYENKRKTKAKKELTENLNKLVYLLSALNKLAKEGNVRENTVSREEDIEIINSFLEKCIRKNS